MMSIMSISGYTIEIKKSKWGDTKSKSNAW